MTKNTKRYNINIPQELFDQIRMFANERGTTAIDVIKRFIRLGLIVAECEKTKAKLIIREEDGTEKEIILL